MGLITSSNGIFLFSVLLSISLNVKSSMFLITFGIIVIDYVIVNFRPEKNSIRRYHARLRFPTGQSGRAANTARPSHARHCVLRRATAVIWIAS